MNPRTVLQQRYPSADLWEYFRFLGECAGTIPEGKTQDHHICPRKQFPEYETAPENLITLTVEDHAHAHELLGAAVPEIKAPPRAYFDSRSSEKMTEDGRKGGRGAAHAHKANRTGFWSPSSWIQRKGGQIAGRINGSVNGLKNVESGHLDSLRTPEHQAAAGRVGSRIANHNRWHVKRNVVSPNCSLCTA